MELITIFKDYGLSGLVIGGLFLQNKFVMTEFRETIKEHERRFKELLEGHENERDTWRDTIEKLIDAISELREKPCQTANRRRASDERRHD